MASGAGPHTPALQLLPVPQRWAQPPQLLTSVEMFTQRPLQAVVEAAQAHLPLTQLAPFWQAVWVAQQAWASAPHGGAAMSGGGGARSGAGPATSGAASTTGMAMSTPL